MLAAIVIGVAGCGNDAAEDTRETTQRPQATGVGQVRAGSVASLAQCSDWNEGDLDAKLATIHDIRAQVNQAGADGPTPDLTDDQAFDLFEDLCAQDYAAGFRLYKFYVRAAGFAPLASDTPQ